MVLFLDLFYAHRLKSIHVAHGDGPIFKRLLGIGHGGQIEKLPILHDPDVQRPCAIWAAHAHRIYREMGCFLWEP